MDLSHLRMLMHELLNNDPDIVQEEAPMIVLDSKSAMYTDKRGKYNNHTRKIARRIHLVRNGEKCKIHNIDWCEGGMKLADIPAKNIGENDLTPRMKYIMVRLDN